MEISKRDYFAAQALTGLLARSSNLNSGLNVHANVATEAFLYADEMLKLSKTLLDPIEIDPDKLAAETAASAKEKSRRTIPLMSANPPDLKARAYQAMIDEGFHPDFPADVLREAQSANGRAASASSTAIQDLRSLPWSSIDNDQSRDLDQIEFAEKLPDGATRLFIGIADVDDLVPASSATDKHAASETTSVYTGVVAFPMLPDGFSTGSTSLLGDHERLAMIIELRVQDSGQVDCHDAFRARVCNRAKLAYSSTGAWLEGRGPIPPAVANVPGMEAQLRLQLEVSKKLRQLRKQNGALTFNSNEAIPIIESDKVKGLSFASHNVAEDIIESFMVAGNVAMAQHLTENDSPSIRRVVRTPRRWDRIREIAAEYGTKLGDEPDSRALSEFLDQRRAADPQHFPDLSLAVVKLLGPGEYVVSEPGQPQEGHFGLAVHDYSHSTAPNRRFADLVTQRLLKAVAARAPAPYTVDALRDIAAHCTERENASRKVERLMRKVIAANLLLHQIGQMFDGIITGASPKGTYVRLLKFPAEGRVIHGASGVDVGDTVRVRLAGVDVAKGFIDFERK